MKKLIIMVGLGWMIGLLNVHTADAQHVTTIIHVNVDRQPAWGPVGYDYVEYYYIPELNIYFDVENELFYYRYGRGWIESPYLPARYARYDFYSLYKVVLNDVIDPWRYNRHHRRRYARYRYNYAQIPIFYVDDYRYEYARYNACAWVEPRYMENRSYYENVELRSNRSTESRVSSGERRGGASSRSESSRISSHRNSDTERYEERSSSGSNRSMRSSREISSGSDRGRSSGVSSEGRRRFEDDFSTNTRSRSERSSATNSSRSDRSADWSTGNDRSRSSEASSENRRNRSGNDVSSSTRSSSSRSSSDSSLDSRKGRSGDDSSSSMRSSRSESSVSSRSDEGSQSRSSESRSSENRSERSGSGGRR